MSTIASLITQAKTSLPILLLDITSRFDGTVLRVSQMPVSFGGDAYQGLVLSADGFDIRLEDAELGIAAIQDVAFTLGNVDGAMSAWDTAHLFKNASIKARLVLYDETAKAVASSDSVTLFVGVCNPPDSENELRMRITAYNRLNPQYNLYPPIRVQQLSPTVFPPEGGKDSDGATSSDQDTALFKIINSESDRSRLDWPCGYGPIRATYGFGGANPVGNFLTGEILNADIFSSTTIGKTGAGLPANLKGHLVAIIGGTGVNQIRRILSNTGTTITVAKPWTTTPDATSDFRVLYGFCGRTKADCQARGMYNTDSVARVTRRFRGFGFTPTDFRYRPWKGKKRLTETDTNTAKFNQAVTVVFGTARVGCRIIFTQTGRQIRGHILVCEGQVSGLRDLIIEGKQIPKNQPVSARADASGNWFERLGARGGNTEHSHFPGHDPYNLMAMIYLDTLAPEFVGGSEFESSVLVTGKLIERFNDAGASIGFAWSDSPGWEYLDVLKAAGWPLSDINLKRFHGYSVYADQAIASNIGSGSPNLKRFTRNLVIAEQRPVSDVLSGIAGGSRILPTYDAEGKLCIDVENHLADTTLSLAVSSTGVQWARVADGAGVAVDERLTINVGGGSEETVTVLALRLTSNNIEFQANFANTHSSGETVKGTPAFDFVESSIAFDEGENRRAIDRRSLSASEVPNEYVAEFQNQYRNFAGDSMTLLDVREASEFGAKLTAQVPGEGFPHIDASVRIGRLQLFKGHGHRDEAGAPQSAGNLYVEVVSSIKGALIRIGQIVRLTWALKGWTLKEFRVVAIGAAQDPQFPYWQIRYVLREHHAQWYKDINNSVVAAPGLPTTPILPPPVDGGGGTGGGFGGGGGPDPRDRGRDLIFL